MFVGKDFERKGGPLVLEAFKIARSMVNDLELYIAGPENKYENIEGVTWLGRLSYTELVKYFNMCDIFCMPSIFEAYGLVFIEALTFGLPCIGRDAYEMPYFIEDGKSGYLLKSNSVEELSNLILKLIDNEEIKNYVRSKREWYIEEYNWDTVADRISKAIDNQ